MLVPPWLSRRSILTDFGHRRLAAWLIGLPTIPVIVRNLTDAEAIITMVDANLQREHILPSEKAFAYKMKMEAMKHQGKTSRQVGTMSRTDEEIAKESQDSARQIQRYIRLTNLIPEILDMVDNKAIALTPAVELSYLTQREQRMLHNIMQMEGATPSLSQAQRMRRMSEEHRLGEGDMEDIWLRSKATKWSASVSQKSASGSISAEMFFPWKWPKSLTRHWNIISAISTGREMKGKVTI